MPTGAPTQAAEHLQQWLKPWLNPEDHQLSGIEVEEAGDTPTPAAEAQATARLRGSISVPRLRR